MDAVPCIPGNDANDKECAFYRRHSDYIPNDFQRLQGVRIFTLYCYLVRTSLRFVSFWTLSSHSPIPPFLCSQNDVTEGGGTRFTDLQGGPVTVMPKKGQAVLWSSVKSNEPHTMDSRTHHEALPVTKGEKFGAVFWIHQHDFKGPYAKSCTAE